VTSWSRWPTYPSGASTRSRSTAAGSLVSRPGTGTVVAFDARCTHQGCTVRATDDGLVCPCHGSAFDPATGAAVHGPATSPLAPVGVAVRGEDVVLT
jgi:Rieske Fe-S protein